MVAVGIVSIMGCARHQTTADVFVSPNGVRCTAYVAGVSPGYSCIEEQAGNPAVRCSGYIAPPSLTESIDTTPSMLPPASYRVADIGKPGVPDLDPRSLATVMAIRHRVRHATLRFALLPQLIVFDATDGPCIDRAGGYPVLNGAPGAFYEPGDDPYSIKASPSAHVEEALKA